MGAVERVRQFQEDENILLFFVLSLKAGGAGLILPRRQGGLAKGVMDRVSRQGDGLVSVA
jgi:hypothetical protein